jgi:hypothetical protein
MTAARVYDQLRQPIPPTGASIVNAATSRSSA